MADNSKIEWTDATWNPITGCSIVSPGCTNCYAMRMAARLEAMGQPRYKGLTKPSKAGAVWTGKMRLVEEALTIPLWRRRPTTYFVNSMSDLFHESVPDEWIDRVFAVMALSPHHTFQVLTKRPTRMREWFEERWQPAPAQRVECLGLPPVNVPAQLEGDDRHERVYQAAGEFLDLDTESDRFWNPDGSRKWPGWPLPNVWLGVSAEDQRRADERIPDLVGTPAAVRFISAEPLLGPIDFTAISTIRFRGAEVLNSLTGELRGMFGDPCGTTVQPIDWIITGGESGPKARPTNPQWYRDIRDQCEGAGTAFLHKQNGAWVSVSEVEGPGKIHTFDDGRNVRFVGKAKAGRMLDGIEHNGMPRSAA